MRWPAPMRRSSSARSPRVYAATTSTRSAPAPREQPLLRLRCRGLQTAAGRRLPAIVHVRDSLDVRAEDRGVFDLVSSNVPFGRITLPPHRRAFYARSTYGHANLYGLFTDAGLHYAKKPAVVAYVTPTSMLSGLYYQALRALLAKEAPESLL